MTHRDNLIQYIKNRLSSMYDLEFSLDRAVGYVSALRDFEIISGSEWFDLLGYIEKLFQNEQ